MGDPGPLSRLVELSEMIVKGGTNLALKAVEMANQPARRWSPRALAAVKRAPQDPLACLYPPAVMSELDKLRKQRIAEARDELAERAEAFEEFLKDSEEDVRAMGADPVALQEEIEKRQNKFDQFEEDRTRLTAIIDGKARPFGNEEVAVLQKHGLVATSFSRDDLTVLVNGVNAAESQVQAMTAQPGVYLLAVADRGAIQRTVIVERTADGKQTISSLDARPGAVGVKHDNLRSAMGQSLGQTAYLLNAPSAAKR